MVANSRLEGRFWSITQAWEVRRSVEAMSRYVHIIGFVILLLLPLRAFGQNPPPVVRAVEITSTWKSVGGGITGANKAANRSGSSEIAIRKEGDKYQLYKNVLDGDALADNTVVAADLIAALEKALMAPAIPQISLEALGITPAWLKARAPSVTQHFAEKRINSAQIHGAMFASAFADPAEVEKVLPGLFDYRHYSCADCTRFSYYVEIVVTFDDSSVLKARAASQFPLMLPWRVIANSPGPQTFNADISRALAALLPEDATNRSRLSGEDLDIQVGRAVLTQVEHQAQLSDVETKTDGTFSALRAKYNIESASIGD